MAAPVLGTKPIPTGTALEDGQWTHIGFATNQIIAFWEKTVQPLGIDGGEPVDQTTMHNQKLRTKAPRSLQEVTNATIKAAYDPSILPDIIALVNVPDTVSIFFPNGDGWAAFGYLQKFEPDALEEGKQPEANITIVFTNMDELGIEQEPVFTAGTGT